MSYIFSMTEIVYVKQENCLLVTDDEDEISFSAGDIITNLKPLGEDWRMGTAPDGRRGVLPAGYIEPL